MKLTLNDLLLDFAMVSFLLVISAWIRRKIKLFQYYYIPVALIAGVLGILLGPQVLGKFSPLCLNLSPSVKQWAGILACIIFSCSFLGLKLNKVEKSALQTYFLAGTIHQVQVIVGLSLAFLLSLYFKNLKLGFGLLPVLAFYGGHPIAIAGGTVFDEAGYMNAGAQVGATFSTVGMLVGVIGGMILINMAAKKGKTRVQMKLEDMPKSMLTGYYEPSERPSMAKEVTFSAALDPFGSQLMLVGFMILCGHILRTLLIRWNPFFKNLPLFVCCLIFTAIFSLVTQNKPAITNHIDRKTITRISGTALEYMIVSCIATTSLSVFTTFAIPLIVISLAVTAITYYIIFVVGNRILSKEDSFETEIGLFGQCTGVLSIGLLLLKVVDPDFNTDAVTNITSSSTLGYTFQLQYTMIFIVMIMVRPLFVYLWSWGLLLLFLGLGLFFGKKFNGNHSFHS